MESRSITPQGGENESKWMLCEGGEAYLVLSVLGEEARGDQPDDYAAQQRHDDE